MDMISEWTIWSGGVLYSMYISMTRDNPEKNTTKLGVTHVDNTQTLHTNNVSNRSLTEEEEMMMENCCAITSYAGVAAFGGLKKKKKFKIDFANNAAPPAKKAPKKSVRVSQKQRRAKEKELREKALFLNQKQDGSLDSNTKRFVNREVKSRPSKYYQFAVASGPENDELYPIIGMKQIAEMVNVKRNSKRRFRKRKVIEIKQQPPKKKEPIIDEDGFQLVCNKRKHRSYEKKPKETCDNLNEKNVIPVSMPSPLPLPAKTSDEGVSNKAKKPNKRQRKNKNKVKMALAESEVTESTESMVAESMESVVSISTEVSVESNKSTSAEETTVIPAATIKTEISHAITKPQELSQAYNIKLLVWKIFLKFLQLLFYLLIFSFLSGNIKTRAVQNDVEATENKTNGSYL